MPSAPPPTGLVQRHLLLTLRWAFPFLAALLPIVLLSVYSLRIASSSVRTLVESANITAVSNVSQLLTEDMEKMQTLSKAIASVPGTVLAAETKDDLTMNIRLKAIVLAYPQIERAFLTDPAGILWSDFPANEGSYGSSQEGADWYRGMAPDWKPFVSGMYLSETGGGSPVIAISTPVKDAAGKVIGVLVFEYSAEQITRALQNIRLGETGYVYIVDQRGTVVAHPQLQDAGMLYGDYASVPQILDAQRNVSSTSEYTDPVTMKKTIATFQPVAVGGQTWVIVAGQPVDEAYRPLQSVSFRIRFAGGLLTLVTLCMVIALALTKRRNEKLTEALGAKNKTLQDITSFVSHQLRAPVTAMRWTIESMLDGDDGPVGDQLRDSLTKLKDVAMQNGNLIDDILNVSRIDRGVIDVVCAPVLLSEIAERALRDYRIALEKAGLSLTLVGMEQPISVLADKEKMAEAVTNSISNAIKHTKKGGITFTLRKDDQYGYIDVSDTGEGMTADIMGKLFDRVGVKGSNTEAAASTGLGLYIARNFMRLQKGDITVSSIEGKGSTFTYSIPLA